jgi:hypothetical protein
MSTVKVDTLVASDGTSPVTLTKQSAAKAWVSNEGGSTNEDSFGISSTTDAATGNFRFGVTSTFSVRPTQTSNVFTTSLNRLATVNFSQHTTSQMAVLTHSPSALEDVRNMNAAHGDLA